MEVEKEGGYTEETVWMMRMSKEGWKREGEREQREKEEMVLVVVREGKCDGKTCVHKLLGTSDVGGLMW